MAQPPRPAPVVPADAPPPAAPKAKSPVRTLVLLGVLLFLMGCYAHDYFIAKPAALKAHEDLQKLVDERNAQGVKTVSLPNSSDVQETIGRAPSWSQERDNATVECYRYWGGLLPQRQYISVMYTGEPRHVHVFYLNAMPEDGDYPNTPEMQPVAAIVESEAPAAGTSASEHAAPETETPEGDAETPEVADDPTAEPPAEEMPADAPAEDATAEPSAAEDPADTTAEPPAAEAPADSSAEAPADDAATEPPPSDETPPATVDM